MQSIKLDSDYALAYYNRGIVYYDKREFDRASQDLNRAIALNPNYAGAFHDRGITNYDKHKFDTEFRAQTRSSPSDRTTRLPPAASGAGTKAAGTTTGLSRRLTRPSRATAHRPPRA